MQGPAKHWPVPSNMAPCAEQTSAAPLAVKNRSGKVSSGKNKCGQRLTKPRNPSGLCQTIMSRCRAALSPCKTKPRASPSSMSLAEQITVPEGGSQISDGNLPARLATLLGRSFCQTTGLVRFGSSPDMAQTNSHSAALTGCTDRRELLTNTISSSLGSVFISAKVT